MITLLLIIIYLSFISLGLPDSLLGTAWPAIYQEIGVPVSYAGIIFMIVSGGTIISSFFSEKIIRKLGTGPVTVISVFMTALALLGMSFSHHFIFFCLLAIPLGLGAGSVDAALNNYVAIHFQAKHMSWLHCFWGIGAALGPVIMAQFLAPGSTKGNWSRGYLTIGVIQIILTAVLLLSLPLWKMAGSEQNEDTQKVSIKTGEVLRLSGAKAILLSFFCYCAIEATVGLWGSSYLVFFRGLDASIAARWVSVFYFGITFGRFLSGFLAIKVSGRRMIRIGEVTLASGILLLLIPLGNGILPVGFLLIGMGCAPVYPSLLHDTPDNFGSRYSQAIMGIQMACAYVGSTFMPPLFGAIAARINYGVFCIYLGIFLLLMIITSETAYRKIIRANHGKKSSV